MNVQDLIKFAQNKVRHGVLMDTARWSLDAAGRVGGWAKQLLTRYDHLADATILRRFRQRCKSGSFESVKPLRVGPNEVFVHVTRRDGTVEDIGLSRNLLTNIGRDVWSGSWGFIGAGVTTASPATAISATTVTVTGTPLTASNLATPQLGLAGQRVFMPLTGLTTAPVYGNIVSNTTSVITVDKWWTVADATATTPASTSGLIVAPGGMAGIRFMALSTNASAASASDTTLASEVTTNGGGRVLATYAHSFGGTTLTLSNTFSFSGTVTAVHKGGLFAALTSAGADPMIYETVFNLDFTVGNGDTAACTWTITPSG
jgi:hypothetical protein